MSDIENEKLNLANMLMNMEYSPVDIPRQQLQTQGYTEIPLTEISSLGAAFSSLVKSFNSVTTTVAPTGEALLRPVNTSISELFSLGANQVRGFVHDGAHFTKSGIFEIVEGKEVVTTAVTFSPATLFIAAAIMSINKKLDDVKETQDKILARFEKKEKAELQGDLNVLFEVLDSYKYYCMKDKIKTENLGLVKHIKKDATQKISYYQDVLADDFIKKSFVQFNRNIDKVMAEVLDYFKYYQLSVYEYTFASFMEIMLAEHFDEAYLNNTIKWINEYSNKYRMIYSDFYDVLDDYTHSSVESKLLGGIAKVGKAAGESIGKLSIAEKITIDDKLVATGEKLENLSTKKASELMGLYREMKDCGTAGFTENIRVIGNLFNRPIDALFDNEKLYVKLNVA